MDRQQIAILNALSAGFSKGVKPHYLSDFFAPYGDHRALASGGAFPHDVVYLPAGTLQRMHAANKAVWTLERCHAYMGQQGPVKQRAAVSSFLWARMQDDPAMNLDTLGLWREVEILNEQLSPQPWAQHLATQAGEALTDWWAARLDPRRAELEQRHQAVLRKILGM